jgi:hypothetical protein
VLSVSFLIFTPKIRALGSDISKSYSGDSAIVAGSLVSLDSGKLGYIVLANSKNSNQLIGVAVDGRGSLIAIDQSENKIQVSINGSASTLVSTVNGDINTGDYIAQSSISGIGAKALPGDKTVGIAQSSFTSKSSSLQKQKITDSNGFETEVSIGQIPVLVSASSLPKDTKDEVSTLEDWASKLVGHRVSLMRIVFCGVIAIISLIALVIIVYSSIHSSIVAVSRNPLAKPMIFEALAQVLVMVALVSVISITTMYLVIRI